MKIKKHLLAFAIFSIMAASGWSEPSYTYSMEMLLYATQQNHPELLKLQEEYKRSLLDVKDAWASLGPTLNLQASGTYMLNPPVGPMYINTDDIINSIQWNGVAPARSGQYIKFSTAWKIPFTILNLLLPSQFLPGEKSQTP